MSKYKAIIFDRDGTLNVSSKKEGGYTLSVEEMKLLPLVKESLLALTEKNILLYVFTQQRCINKGLLTELELKKINNRLNELLDENVQIAKFYHCPHLITDGCECTKPKPGMLIQCMKDNNLQTDEVLVVGDMLRDYESAKAAGIDFAFVANDLGKATEDEYLATGAPLYKNLAEIVSSYF